MARFEVTAPDGSRHEVNAPEGATAEDALDYIKRKVASESNYSNEGRSRPTERNEAADEGVAGRYWEGVKGGAARMRDAMFPPGNPVHALSMGTIGSDNVPARKEALAHYERTKDQLGTAGFAGDITPEVVASAVPLSRVGTTISKAPLLAKTLGRYAPAVADIAANAGYEAGKTALSGGSAGDIGQSALVGGGGAAAGRVLTRALGGVKPLVSQSARKLVDAGVIPTPGQLFGEGYIGSGIRSLEDKAMSIPGVGDVIGYARRRGTQDFNRATVNEALQPFQHIIDSPKPAFDEARRVIGTPRVSSTGDEAIDAAQKKISAAFNTALDGMDMGAKHVDDAIGATREVMDLMPLLDANQTAKINRFIELRLAPHADAGGLTGQNAKAIDAEIGSNARKFSRSVNPEDHAMGEAYYALQQKWRSSMKDAAHEAGLGHKTALLEAANSAYKNLLPIIRASDKAAAQGGVFTPNQLQRAAQFYKQDPTALTQTAQGAMPGRVPDSGTAGRLLLPAVLTGSAAISGGVATAAGLTAALYSRPGMNLFLNGMGSALPAASHKYLRMLSPQAAAQEVQRMATKYPHLAPRIAQVLRSMPSGSQAAAQTGRMVATEGEMQ